jgi:UDPglucose 6-dehydrogenase
MDVDEEKIADLQRGAVPIYEPGLEELIQRNLREGRLSFTTDLASAVKASLLCFIAVGTPQGDDGSADVRVLLNVARDIGRLMPGYRVVVLKSTVPVGTADLVQETMREVTPHPFDVISNPEFLKEGAALEDFQKPDRVVLGGDSERALSLLKELYAPFVRTENPILVMDTRSAEMTKYAANGFLATRISFINEIALLCERMGADVTQVRRAMGFDRRIGHAFLFPGVGYGGSCFPKDVRALVRMAEVNGHRYSLLRAVDEINERQKRVLVEKVKAHFGPDLRGKLIAVWGLAFKARTDDMREAPSVVIVESLLAGGAEVAVHDPEALGQARTIFGERVSYHPVNYEALRGADALLVVTEWNEFRQPDFVRMRALMRQAVIFDGRNLYEPEVMRQAGFIYYAIGRGPLLPEGQAPHASASAAGAAAVDPAPAITSAP